MAGGDDHDPRRAGPIGRLDLPRFLRARTHCGDALAEEDAHLEVLRIVLEVLRVLVLREVARVATRDGVVRKP